MLTEYFVLFVLSLASILVILRRRSSSKKKYNLPPGPYGVPFLGNLLQIVQKPYLKLSQWADTYGPIYSIKLGTRPALIISNATSMKDIFNLPASTGKFKTDTMLLMSRGPYGIFNTTGADWVEQRNFCLKSLVQFGFGNIYLEPHILSECQDLVDIIRKQSAGNIDNGVEISTYLKVATNNTLLTILMGERVELQLSKEFGKIQEMFLEGLQKTVKSGLGFFPWLKYIAPGLSGYTLMDGASIKVHQFWIGHIKRHMHSHISGAPRDLIDAYLDKMQTDDKSSSFYGDAGWKNSVATIVELFEAGNETTSSSIVWLLYHVAHNAEVQRKVHEELDQVLGNSEPSLTHKGKLPYTEAVILESLRICPVAVMGIFHELLEDVEYQGYKLPKDMILLANTWHCHHDKKVWGDPEIFRPERFLGDGEKLKDMLTTFQLGKRSCLGEPLAKDIMFLFVAKLLQEFEIKPVQNISKEEYFYPDLGLGYLPKPRKLVMSPRV